MTQQKISLTTPLIDEDIKKLRTGDTVSLSGVVYTARDAAHARIIHAIEMNESLPFDLKGQVIFYVGPTPAKPGQHIGSIGPTTATRMDPFTPTLLDRGLKGMIGKGRRSEAVISSIIKNNCVYFGAIEGTAALISQRIQAAQLIAYEDLGPEAIYKLTFMDLPVVVINDIYGGDLYRAGKEKYAVKRS